MMLTTRRRARRFARALAAAFTATVLTGTLVGAAPSDPPAFIVGGSPAEIDAYPAVLALTSRKLAGNTRSGQFCAATLIAPDKALTAAHCFFDNNGNRTDIPDLTVVHGRGDLRTRDGGEVAVRSLYIAEGYEYFANTPDWAVLNLAAPIAPKPMAMVGPGEQVYTAGTSATVLGWGDTTGHGDYSPVLRAVTLPIVSDVSCGRSYPAGQGVGYDEDTMVCAGERSGGRDACQADSGGPLLIGGRLAGIVSWGEGCALPGRPGVYTRLATFAQDIQRILDADGL